MPRRTRHQVVGKIESYEREALEQQLVLLAASLHRWQSNRDHGTANGHIPTGVTAHVLSLSA
jgi:hypothetical protein